MLYIQTSSWVLLTIHFISNHDNNLFLDVFLLCELTEKTLDKIYFGPTQKNFFLKTLLCSKTLTQLLRMSGDLKREFQSVCLSILPSFFCLSFPFVSAIWPLQCFAKKSASNSVSLRVSTHVVYFLTSNVELMRVV